MMRIVARASYAVRSGISARASCAGNSGAGDSQTHHLFDFRCDESLGVAPSRTCLRSASTVASCGSAVSPPLTTAALSGTDPFGNAVWAAKGLGKRCLHSQRIALDDTSEETPNSVAAALAARPPPPPLPYDSDEDSTTGAGEAPFVPPQIDKLIKMIMRHGKKEQARRIVFDATHAMYNAARAKNPRPELRQRNKDFAS